jgi:hypothetical protein
MYGCASIAPITAKPAFCGLLVRTKMVTGCSAMKEKQGRLARSCANLHMDRSPRQSTGQARRVARTTLAYIPLT